MEFPFEGIPTIPPRKDVEHISFFCDGCRYRCASVTPLERLKRHGVALGLRRYPTRRMKGGIDEKVAAIKQRLWEGGCGRGAEMSTGKRKVIERCCAPRAIPRHATLSRCSISQSPAPPVLSSAVARSRSWQNLVLIFAGQQMADEYTLRDYHVPEARDSPSISSPPLCRRRA